MFGEQITIDEGGTDDNKTPDTTSAVTRGQTDEEKNLKDEAKHESERAKAKGFDKGALVGRAAARDQILNPWTWGIVLFVTPVPHPKEGIAPVGVCWASAPNSRAVSNEKIESLILISRPPTDTYLNALKDG